MVALNTIRRISIEARAAGVDEARAKVEALGKAHDGLVVASDRVERAQLSTARALERVQRTFDAQYRAEQRAIVATRTLDTARAQGLIGYQRHAELLEMVQRRTTGVVVANDNAAASVGRLSAAYQAAAPLMARFGIGQSGALAAIGGAGALAGGAAAAGIGAGLAAIATARAGDEWVGYSNRILATGESVQATKERMEELVGVAIRSRAEMSGVVDLYSSLSRSTADLGVSQSTIMRLTETISKSFAANGTAASAASGAILQLGQAFQSGTLRGDEFNSVMEQAPGIARLIAREYGVGMGELRKLAEEGRLSADRVFQGIARGAQEIEREFGRTSSTMGEAMRSTVLSLTEVYAKLDSIVGIQPAVVGALDLMTAAYRRMSGALGAVGDGMANLAEKQAIMTMGQLESKIQRFESNLAHIRAGGSRLDPSGTLAPATESRLAEARRELQELQERAISRHASSVPAISHSDGFIVSDRVIREGNRLLAESTTQLTKVRTEGLEPLARAEKEASDAYAKRTAEIDALAQKGGEIAVVARLRAEADETRRLTIEQARLKAAKSESGGSGRRMPRDDDPRAYEQAAKRVEDQNRRLEQQAATFGMTAGEAARYRVEMELVAAINRTGKEATEVQREEIARLAEQAGQATERLERLRQIDQLRNMGADFAKGLVSDLRQGVDAADALRNALDRLADRLIDMTIDQAFKDLFSGASSGAGAGGGLFASLAKLLGGGFAGGGYTGHGSTFEPAGVVHRGEFVFDAASTRMIGVGTLEAMRKGLKGYASGGYVGPAPAPAAIGGPPVLNVSINQNAPGVQASARQTPNGLEIDIDAVADAIEGRMTGRLVRGQGGLAQASGGSPHLRG